MNTLRLRSSYIGIIIGLSFITFGFQNCTKAKFSVDEVTRQKALDEGSVFGNGNDGAVPGGVKAPGDDAGAPGPLPKNPPGDDAGNPQPVPQNPPFSFPNFPPTAGGDDPDTDDPLLVQLNTKTPQPIELTAPDKGVMFDLLGRRIHHKKVLTSWFATANTENYFLVLPDEKGQVNGIDELFGNSTFGPDKRFSRHGFQALAKHDDNKDHMISSDDGVFSQLRLWKDDNLDGIAQENELSTLDAKGVVVIDLRFDRRYMEKDQYGNMVKFKSVVIMKDNSYGLVYDLWLRFIAK
jgi:hypothetical protein